MRPIEVERILSNTEKELWVFINFDFTLVLNSYHKFEKPKGKRKWVTIEVYERLGIRNRYAIKTLTESELQIPELVSNEALSKAIEQIRVVKWSEYKR